jgi:hypothetical protein
MKPLISPRKVLLLLSLALITVWVTGFFFLGSSAVIHSLFFLAVLFYIRSLMIVEVPDTDPLMEE